MLLCAADRLLAVRRVAASTGSAVTSFLALVVFGDGFLRVLIGEIPQFLMIAFETVRDKSTICNELGQFIRVNDLSGNGKKETRSKTGASTG